MASVKFASRSDLSFYKPDIGQYDRKATVQNWVTVSGIVRKSANVGQPISVLYRDGEELGSAQSSAGAVDTDGEWHYDLDTDLLTLASSNNPAVACVIEVGLDVKTAQDLAISKASDFIRAYIDKPITPRKGTHQADASGHTYEEIIQRATCLLAISYLLRGIDDEQSDYYESKVYDIETGEGIADRIKKGCISLWNESKERLADGVVSENSVSGTGTIVDTKGHCNVDYDLILVKVVSSGTKTFTLGSESEVKIDSYISNDSGMQMQKYASNETVDGSYIPIGRGISVRFSEGTYIESADNVTNTWHIECNGQFVESGEVKNAQAWRR